MEFCEAVIWMASVGPLHCPRGGKRKVGTGLEHRAKHLAAGSEKQNRQAYAKTALTLISVLLVTAIVLLNVFTYVLNVVRYYGDGMEPTLHSGQVLLVLKTHRVSQGDVIAFYYNNKVLVRRVTCMGGEQVSIEKDGTVSVSGTELEEPYLEKKSIGQCNLEFPYYVPPNTVFVMGDNRDVAMDSRLDEIGPISLDRVIGKVLLVF